MPQIIKGSFVSTGAATPLSLVIDPDYIEVWIQGNAAGDNFDSAANPGVTKIAKWFKGMTAGHAFTIRNTDGAATDQCDYLAANGFTVYDGSVQTPGPAVTGTAVSQAAAAVCADVAHGFVVGDRIVVSNCTGMRQIEGMTFEITVANANDYTIPIDTSAFVAPATAITSRKLPALPLFGPRKMFITGITAANPMVVSVSETHAFSVGGKVKLEVPAEFGMTQANGLVGTITAVTARTFTLDIDSSAFTAFAFPASAGVPFTHAHVVPVGEDATTLVDSITNGGFRGVVLGTGVCGPNAARVYYTATKADAVV